jgi:hypothetical protein
LEVADSADAGRPAVAIDAHMQNAVNADNNLSMLHYFLSKNICFHSFKTVFSRI